MAGAILTAHEPAMGRILDVLCQGWDSTVVSRLGFKKTWDWNEDDAREMRRGIRLRQGACLLVWELLTKTLQTDFTIEKSADPGR